MRQQPGVADVCQVVARALAIGAVLPVAGNSTDDQPRIALAERLMCEAEAAHHPWPEALDQHVGAVHQAQQRLAPLRMLQIESGAALIAIDGDERPASVARERWHAARVLPLALLLDVH